MPGSSEDLTFGSLMICKFSTSFIIFATGISCLVISIIELVKWGGKWGDIECSYGGKPPLMEWVVGTGIAFSIISCSFALLSCNNGGKVAKLILAVANLFVMVWGIVGIFSLGKWGKECKVLYPSLWRMGYAAVVISFIVCCCGGFVGYKAVEVPVTEAEVVLEEADVVTVEAEAVGTEDV